MPSLTDEHAAPRPCCPAQLEQLQRQLNRFRLIVHGVKTALPTPAHGQFTSLFSNYVAVSAGHRVLRAQRLGSSSSYLLTCSSIKFRNAALGARARLLKQDGLTVDVALTPAQIARRKAQKAEYFRLKAAGARPVWQFERLYTVDDQGALRPAADAPAAAQPAQPQPNAAPAEQDEDASGSGSAAPAATAMRPLADAAAAPPAPPSSSRLTATTGSAARYDGPGGALIQAPPCAGRAISDTPASSGAAPAVVRPAPTPRPLPPSAAARTTAAGRSDAPAGTAPPVPAGRSAAPTPAPPAPATQLPAALRATSDTEPAPLVSEEVQPQLMQELVALDAAALGWVAAHLQLPEASVRQIVAHFEQQLLAAATAAPAAPAASSPAPAPGPAPTASSPMSPLPAAPAAAAAGLRSLSFFGERQGKKQKLRGPSAELSPSATGGQR